MLEVSVGAQGAAAFLYAWALLGPKSPRAHRVAMLLARAALVVGWAVLGAWLWVRAREQGWQTPLWARAPHAALTAAWVWLSLLIWRESRREGAGTGFFMTAAPAMASGVALLWLWAGRVEVVADLPAWVRSPVAWVCVPSAVLGLGYFALAAVYGGLGAIRLGVRAERLFAPLAIAGLAIMGFAEFFGAAGPEWSARCVVPTFWAFAVHLIVGALDLRLMYQDRWDAELDPRLVGLARPRRGLKALQLGSFALGLAGLGVAGVGLLRGGHFTVAYSAGAIGVLGVFGLLWVARAGAAEARLPEPEALDLRSHQAALAAFPWLTVHLLTGLVWSYQVWGSPWAWSPRLVWSGIAWAHLALVLSLDRERVSTLVLTALGALWIWVAVLGGGAWPFWPGGY